jgi:hypothetical protein
MEHGGQGQEQRPHIVPRIGAQVGVDQVDRC